jgi:hypothetical protein
MATKIYGSSDDLIEFEGDFNGESGCCKEEQCTLIVLNDGTILKVKYGKNDKGLWGITLLQRGSLFDRIDQCSNDEDAEIYSDIAYFKDGVKWAYAASEWEYVH